MTRSNVAQRLDIAVARAAAVDSSLAKRRISPHTIRHATAMSLLQSGVAFNVIALWLGHEDAPLSSARRFDAISSNAINYVEVTVGPQAH